MRNRKHRQALGLVWLVVQLLLPEEWALLDGQGWRGRLWKWAVRRSDAAMVAANEEDERG